MSRLQDSRAAGVPGAERTGSGFSRLLSTSKTKTRSLLLAESNASSCWTPLATAVDSGAAVMVSRTSDGGAISLTLYLGSNRYREYATTQEQLIEVLRALAGAAEAATS